VLDALTSYFLRARRASRSVAHAPSARGCLNGQPTLRSRIERRPGRSAKEDFMHIIGWILFGLVVGIVAKFLMPGRDPGGFVITAVLGIVGGLVGGFVGRAMGWYGDGDSVGFVMAVIGSIIVLALYRFTIGRTQTV
jgi:uncharacterized membrane protein YeaQ/YmgE (transglycosylase-associated protein family)